MKLKIFTVLAVVVTLIAGFAWANSKKKALQQQEREAHYHALLETYRLDLKGISDRKHIEAYFHAKTLNYHKLCCVSSKRVSAGETVYDELIKVGEEEVPWYCSEHNVYIAFEFDKAPIWAVSAKKDAKLISNKKPSAKTGPDKECKSIPPRDDGNDVLTKISIYPMFEGCL
jgi:hypothetical protein